MYNTIGGVHHNFLASQPTQWSLMVGLLLYLVEGQILICVLICGAKFYTSLSLV